MSSSRLLLSSSGDLTLLSRHKLALLPKFFCSHFQVGNLIWDLSFHRNSWLTPYELSLELSEIILNDEHIYLKRESVEVLSMNSGGGKFGTMKWWGVYNNSLIVWFFKNSTQWKFPLSGTSRMLPRTFLLLVWGELELFPIEREENACGGLPQGRGQWGIQDGWLCDGNYHLYRAWHTCDSKQLVISFNSSNLTC